MTYTVECSLEDFSAWSGGLDRLNELRAKGGCEEVELNHKGGFMKRFVFTVCDVYGCFTRKITVEDVEDLSCAMNKLDNQIHDDEYILDYKEAL